MARPALSVVVPTYRRPDLMRRCLCALLQQRLPPGHYEIIVVHDGPDEHFGKRFDDIAKSSPVSVRMFCLPANRGPAAARNFGWRRARGWLIAFTDDDCIPATDWLLEMQAAYDGVSLTGTRRMAAFSGVTRVPIPKTPTDYELNISRLEQAPFITANCAITKSALRMVNGFDEDFKTAWREDSDMQFRLTYHHIPIVKTRAVVVHPVRKVPWGACLRDEKKGMYDALLYKKHPQKFEAEVGGKGILRQYYLTLAAAGVAATGIVLKWPAITYLGASVWLFSWGWLLRKRLVRTSRAPRHVIEMAATSPFLPILSVFWRWYGIIKFRSRPF